MDKALKKLNEEKNIINSDIDIIRFAFYDGNFRSLMKNSPLFRNDIRTNENSRRNQDSIFTNKLDQLKQKQTGEFYSVTIPPNTSLLQLKHPTKCLNSEMNSAEVKRINF